jgi:hypothetical protein
MGAGNVLAKQPDVAPGESFHFLLGLLIAQLLMKEQELNSEGYSYMMGQELEGCLRHSKKV